MVELFRLELVKGFSGMERLIDNLRINCFNIQHLADMKGEKIKKPMYLDQMIY